MDAAVGSRVVVVDREAFETNDLWLLFRDARGNIVKDSPIRPDELASLVYYSMGGSIRESYYWESARTGKQYKTRGKIMRQLLPAAMALGKPPVPSPGS